MRNYITKVCSQCGNSYTFGSRGDKYDREKTLCSVKCRQDKCRIGTPTITRKCKQCGKDFSIKVHKYQVETREYCSRECSGLDHRGPREPRAMCKNCRVVPVRQNRFVFCSHRCSSEHRAGAGSYNWKGGRTADSRYIRIKAPGHPSASTLGYVYEHRLVAEKALGRTLGRREMDVHHIDGNSKNNDPENLEVLSRSAHMKIHHQQKREIKCQAK